MPQPTQITLKAIDLTRRLNAYDGSPEDWDATIQVWQPPRQHWNFTLAEIDSQNFAQLEEILGSKNFRLMLKSQGFAYPKNEWDSYRGKDNLSVRYCLRPSEYPDPNVLILVSFGEFQPMRWLAHIEGVWQVHEMG